MPMIIIRPKSEKIQFLFMSEMKATCSKTKQLFVVHVHLGLVFGKGYFPNNC